MANVLFIIEAPGKIKTLSQVLKKLDLDADIWATYGHLFENPKSLIPTGINKNFEETLRAPVSQSRCDDLVRLASRYEHIIVATDPDQEGDAIASDIYDLLGNRRLLRTRFYGMDEYSIKKGLESISPLVQEDGVPGKIRRILDRLIGAAFSDHENKIYVGRIQTAILGLLAKFKQEIGSITFYLPAEEGEPFRCVLPLLSSADFKFIEFLQKESLKLPPAKALMSMNGGPASIPWNYGEAVANIADRMDCDISKVSSAMQSLYEDGLMSYPRASAHGITKYGARLIESIAIQNDLYDTGSKSKDCFSREMIPVLDDKHAHESPRPLSDNVRIDIPIKLLDFEHAVLSMITRNLLLSGIKKRIEIADTSKLPQWAKNFKWYREILPPLPWKDPAPEPGIRKFRPDVAILRLMIQNHLGRPSTQCSHVRKFLSRKLVDKNLDLTDLGKEWLSASPEALLDPNFSNQIEEIIDMNDGIPYNFKIKMIISLFNEDFSRKIEKMTI